ncbi:YrbL family protein [Ruegeria sp.]|uniref:YrbL family protein n=1 Tax=Ruegeria sp. TaxID=1879320 RepID=UPI003B5C8ED9
MIDLSNIEPLRKSQNYSIFNHPQNPGALLKVRTDKPKNRLIKRYSEFRYGNLRQWSREANEYLAAMNRGCSEIRRLAGFLGYAVTSKGPALVVEKMTAPGGGLAPTLAQELAAAPQGSARRAELLQELAELLDDLDRGRIIVGDISTQNIVRAQERDGKLVVIDGLGERVLLPLTLISDRAFRLQSARRRKRMLV